MVYIEYSLSCEKVKFLHLTRLGFYSFGHVSFMHVKNKTSKYNKETNHISAKLSEGLTKPTGVWFTKSKEKPSTD